MSNTYTLELEVNLANSDSNRILGVNKFVKHKIFKQVKNDIHLLSLGKRPLVPLTSFHISAVRHSPKFLDFDNLISSLKPFIDGLTLAKVIEDDSWEFIKNIAVDQVKSKTKKLVITVREVA